MDFIEEIYEAPEWYKFKHPCGNVVLIEEQFWYDPDKPEPRGILIEDIDTCLGCPSYFYREETGKGMCQGLEIVVFGEKLSYIKK